VEFAEVVLGFGMRYGFGVWETLAGCAWVCWNILSVKAGSRVADCGYVVGYAGGVGECEDLIIVDSVEPTGMGYAQNCLGCRTLPPVVAMGAQQKPNSDGCDL